MRENFVLVAGNLWYHKRRQDAEGEFVRMLGGKAAELPNRKIRDTGNVGRQGIYCFTADGELLNWRNHTGDPEVILAELKTAIFHWRQLPEDRREPGATKVEVRGPSESKYDKKLPGDALVVNVYIRALDRKANAYCVGTSTHPGGTLAARDRMWLDRDDWLALVPHNVQQGDSIEIPQRLRERILRFHLVDHTRGQGYNWQKEQIRADDLALTVVESTPSRLRLRLRGSALMASKPNVTGNEPEEPFGVGFDVALLGGIEYDRSRRRFSKFNLVAVGEHWGEWRYNRGARPGRTPLGIAYELASDDDPYRAVPPQGMLGSKYAVADYWGKN